MKAMILSAGLGRRMLPLTEKTPKPLLQAGGKPLIVHTIERLKAAGINDIVINVSYLAEQIRSALGDGSQWSVNISYSYEEQLLETAGAINQALGLLGPEPFLLVNGDIWTDFPLASLVNKPVSGLAHLVLVNNPEHNPNGDFAMNSNGLVQSGLSYEAADHYTYCGIAVISPEFITRYPKRRPIMPLIEPLNWAIEQGQLSAEYYEGAWQDIGTPERLQALDESLTDNA